MDAGPPERSAFGRLCVAVTPGARKRHGQRRVEAGLDRTLADSMRKGLSDDEEDVESDVDGPEDDALDELDADEDDPELRAEEAAAMAKGESETSKLIRTRTLEKYTRVLEQGQGEEELGSRFQARADRALLQDQLASNPDLLSSRRKRAQTLKDNFFALGDRGRSVNLTRLDVDEESLGTVSEEMEDLNYAAMEQALEASARELASDTRAALPEEQRALLDAHCEAIDVMAKRFAADQRHAIKETRARTKKLVPQLKRQIHHLSSQLKEKLNEDFASAGQATRRRGLFGRRKQPQSATRQSSRSTASGGRDQEKYEAELSRLRKELAVLQRQLSQLRLEERFPEGHWKLKVDAGDGTFLGVRDMEVGKIGADFTIETKGNRVTLRVTKIEATLGILDLSIRGSNTRAKILGGLLTPTINRLDLDVKGEWTLELQYIPGDQRRPQAYWEEVRENSHFALDISRKVTGLTTMRLPKSMLQSLSKMLIPKLISGALRSLLPPQLGSLLCEGHNRVRVTGRVDIKGDMSPTVWREPLVGLTPAAARAREALGITEEEAVIVDFMCRGERAAAAGFKPKAVSLARLFKWRLKYASFRIADLQAMLDLVQLDAKVNLPPGWLAQLLKSVTILTRKPLDIRFNIVGLELDVDFAQAMSASLDVYLSNFRTQLNMARADRARAAALKHLQRAQENAITINDVVTQYVIPMVNDRVQFTLNGMLLGGLDTGLIALSLREAQAQARLPQQFFLSALLPAQPTDLPVEVEGMAGPREGEYTVRIGQCERGSKPLVSADGLRHVRNPDSEISLRNTSLQLFPAGMPPGTVVLDASEVRASLMLSTLDSMLEGIGDRVQERAAQAPAGSGGGKAVSLLQGDLSEETRELVERAEALVAVYRKADLGAEDERDDFFAPPSHGELISKALPRFLSRDANDLRFDVKALELQAVKIMSPLQVGKQTLRVTARPQVAVAGAGRTCAVFRVRMDMRDVFDLSL